METKILNFNDDECLEILGEDQILAFPTETVYGLACNADSVEAFNNLCKTKNRPVDKPFTIMVSSKDEIKRYVDLTKPMEKLIDTFMPGEITIIFPAKKDLPYHLTLGMKTVGIRIPNLKEIPDLIQRFNHPLLVSSCNISGNKPLLNTEEVYKEFNQKIKGIVKGVCSSFIPSTIVLIDGDNLKLIRQGSLAFEEINKVWKQSL